MFGKNQMYLSLTWAMARRAARDELMWGPQLPAPAHPCHAFQLSCASGYRMSIRGMLRVESPVELWHVGCG